MGESKKINEKTAKSQNLMVNFSLKTAKSYILSPFPHIHTRSQNVQKPVKIPTFQFLKHPKCLSLRPFTDIQIISISFTDIGTSVR